MMRPYIHVLSCCAFVLSLTGCGGIGGGRPSAAPNWSADSAASKEAGEAELTGPVPQPEPQSGVLTAGSFDDNRYPKSLEKMIASLTQAQSGGSLVGRLQGKRIEITVKDGQGRPVGNAQVKVSSGQQQSSVALVSRSDGRVIFAPAWDGGSSGDLQVTASHGSATANDTIPAGKTKHTITLSMAQAGLPKHLDLALVIDATGSMSDELNYLKTEIKSISKTIKSRFPDVDQRFSLVVYRDEGDEYVTRVFPFTGSLLKLNKNISDQQAGGGGDTPEAMHKALEDLLQQQWRSKDTARVTFLIADAPPHAEHVKRTLKAIDGLRRNGVAIYPIAASGTTPSTELIMRAGAMLTGGQYLFLTDDSGVGDAHAEPHIPHYHVQRLDHLMIRMVAGELSGKRIEPEPNQIIRTMGKPITER